MKKKAIILQFSRMGDLLQSTLLFNSLKKKGRDVYVIGDEKNKELANEIPVIDEFISFNIGENLSYIKNKKFDLCYNNIETIVNYLNKKNFHELYNLNHSDISFYFALLIKSQIKKGFKIEENSFVKYIYKTILNRTENRFNLVDIFNHFTDNCCKSRQLFLNLEEKDNHKNFLNKVFKKKLNIILHLGAGHPLREWGVDKFANLALLILDNFDCTITLTGTRRERKLGVEFTKVLKKSYKERIINLIGKTNISLLKAVVKNSSLIISTDTGIMHLAAACGTNIIALFYASAFVFETGPYLKNAIIVSVNIPCYPCTEHYQYCNNTMLCKKKITPQDVFQPVNFLLGLVNKDSLKSYAKNRENIIFYEPYFDEFGICYKNILDATEKNYKVRAEGFKLCMKN